MRLRKVLFEASPWLTAASFFLIWELACRIFRVPVFVLPPPSEAVAALVEFWPAIWLNASHTLFTTLLGFAIAVGFGVALGVIVGASPLAYRALNPLLIGFNSIPKVAVVPILVLWFGIGTVPAVVTAFLTAFFPISVNVARRQQARHLAQSRAAAFIAVFFCISQDRYYAGLHRCGHLGDGRIQSGHRLFDALGKLHFSGATCICGTPGDRGYGSAHVRGGGIVRASLYGLGDQGDPVALKISGGATKWARG